MYETILLILAGTIGFFISKFRHDMKKLNNEHERLMKELDVKYWKEKNMREETKNQRSI